MTESTLVYRPAVPLNIAPLLSKSLLYVPFSFNANDALCRVCRHPNYVAPHYYVRPLWPLKYALMVSPYGGLEFLSQYFNYALVRLLNFSVSQCFYRATVPDPEGKTLGSGW